MAEYIDRELAKKFLISDYAYAAAELLDDVPSADVTPILHGRWVKMDTTGLLSVEPVWNCSSCGYPVGVSVAGSKYCPSCGCKMDGDVDVEV